MSFNCITLRNFGQIQEKLKRCLSGAINGSLHFIIDIWTTRQQEATMGFNVQFINEEWKMQLMTVAFKHFLGSHTGSSVRAMLHNVLEKECGINPEKVNINLI